MASELTSFLSSLNNYISSVFVKYDTMAPGILPQEKSPNQKGGLVGEALVVLA